MTGTDADPLLRHPIHTRICLPISVRDATKDDSAAVAEIYNKGIRDRTATFETSERTAAEASVWLDDTGHNEYGIAHPFLVAERKDCVPSVILGWIRASHYRTRACYAGIAEFSVYVAASARGCGVGDCLMSEFIPACADARLWKLVSRIFPENAASRALCARHGFREVGRYENHAQLDGTWRDVVIVERLLFDKLRSS